jgi:hypothetical protein
MHNWWASSRFDSKCKISAYPTRRKLDLEASKYDDSEVAWVNMKYEKAVRLCLGCGIYEEAGGTTVGVCAKPFCYSGKLLISLKDGWRNVVAKIA